MFADLKIKQRAFEYQNGLKNLKSAFDISNAALLNEIDIKSRALNEYWDSGNFIGEYDEEEGYLLWSQDHILQSDIDALDAMICNLNKSFIITMFHYWERYAQLIIGEHTTQFEKIYNKLSDKLKIIIPEKLKLVNKLAVTIKHGNAKKYRELTDEWPEVTNDFFQFMSPYEKIIIKNEIIDEVLSIISKSGESC